MRIIPAEKQPYNATRQRSSIGSNWFDYRGPDTPRYNRPARKTRDRKRGEKRGRACENKAVVTHVYTYGLRGDVRSRTAWVRFCLTDGPEWARVLAHRNAVRCNATRRRGSRDATRGTRTARHVTRNLGFRLPGGVDSSLYLSPRPSYAPETTARQLRSPGKVMRMPLALEAIDTGHAVHRHA